ncbi:MAG: zinc ribbon domain-containing protein [Bdellovibrionia bacterium]
MPLYEYKCSNCQKVHEEIQKFSDAPLEICPSCQGPLTKLMSMSSFSLKGTGWYTTDYKRSSAPAGAEGSSEAKTGTEASSDGKEVKASSDGKDGKNTEATAKESKTESTASPASSSGGSQAEKKSSAAETKSVEKPKVAPAAKASPTT